MSKKPLKFFIRGLLIIAIGFGAVYAVQFWRQRTNPEYQVLQYFRDLERQYREDPYGGNTPEETLQLFIDALKKGDIELAAKYFLIEGQEKTKHDLEGAKTEERLTIIIQELERAILKKDSDTAYFTVVRNSDLPSELVMHKNPLNNKWKITEF